MALQNNDLFVIQSQTDNQLYKLKLSDLVAEIEGQAGVNFRGEADLNNPPAFSGITLPAPNGDLYMVASDAAVIDAGWNMQGGETSATKGDRIIFDGDNNNWILISSGSSNAGTVTDITASLPLKSDGDPVTPVLSIREARTLTAATAAGDGEGTDGAVHRLAESDDVSKDGTGDARAVVTADLLKATNTILEGLVLAPGGVQSVTYENTDGNDAIIISPTSGAVKLDLKDATEGLSGVGRIASASDITAGTATSSALIHAGHLKAVSDTIPVDPLQSLTEGGTDIVTGALQIATDADNEVTIGVNQEVFVPFNFAALPDITA